MRKSMYYLASVGAVVALTLVALVQLNLQGATKQDTVKAILSETHTQEEVWVNGHRMFVVSGDVLDDFGQLITDTTVATQARMIAYQRIIARRDGLFVIDGTDTTVLREAIHDLIATDRLQRADFALRNEHVLSSVELYPVSYLLSLARAQDARRDFFASSTMSSFYAYHTALLSVVREYESALDAGVRLVEASYPNEPMAVLGGELTRESALRGIDALSRQVRLIRSILNARFVCATFKSAHCASLPALPQVQFSAHSRDERARKIAAARIIGPLFQSAGPINTGFDTRRMYVLSDSVCRKNEKGPFVALYNPDRDVRVHHMFVHNVLFFRLYEMRKDPGYNVRSFYEKAGRSIVPRGFSSYYACPNAGAELAQVLFLSRASNTVQARSQIIVDSEVLNALHAETIVVATSTEDAKIAAVAAEHAIATWQAGSSGFELIVQAVADVGRGTHLSQSRGVPLFNNDPRAEIAIQGGIFPLLMFYNPTINLMNDSPYSGDRAEASERFLTEWTPSRQPVSSQAIKKAFEDYNDFHQLIHPTE